MFKTDKRRVDKDDLKLLYFTDSNQGQCDCVCQCYHVLQGALFNHNDDFCIVVFVIRQNSQSFFSKTSQELRMLSRSVSDCKSLLLNVMIQVSQFVSEGTCQKRFSGFCPLRGGVPPLSAKLFLAH